MDKNKESVKLSNGYLMTRIPPEDIHNRKCNICGCKLGIFSQGGICLGCEIEQRKS